MKASIRSLSAAALFGLMSVGCASSRQEGVTTDYLRQSVNVSADVETTTEAAKSVFADDKLTDVSSQASKIDGEASGVTADKTKIWASVKKSDTGSTLTVQVGKLGSPKVGADYAAKIKQVAEGKK